MSSPKTRTFRGETLDSVLGAVHHELGPEALVVRQREGVVGGLGGFFGKRCVEVDIEFPPEAPPRTQPAAMPARALTDAYTPRPVEAFAETFIPEDLDGDKVFRSLIGDSSVFASTLAQAIDQNEIVTIPAPEAPDTGGVEPGTATSSGPVQALDLDEPAALSANAASEARGLELERLTSVGSARAALGRAGLDLRLAENIVSEAETQLRIFDPTEPFENQVRQVLAGRIATRRPTGRFRRRVIALVGAPGSGKTSAAVRLCEAYAASGGRRVVALSLEPVRKALELGRQTEELQIELITADHPGLVDFALERLARAEVVIVDTPGIRAGDATGWSSLAALLAPLCADETHLALPGSLDAAAIDALLGTATAQLPINRLLLTHLEGSAGVGPSVSASISAGIPISATATSTRLHPADPYELARTILP
jgi:flagellar biosynthesis GTPase FlhF